MSTNEVTEAARAVHHIESGQGDHFRDTSFIGSEYEWSTCALDKSRAVWTKGQAGRQAVACGVWSYFIAVAKSKKNVFVLIPLRTKHAQGQFALNPWKKI